MAAYLTRTLGTPTSNKKGTVSVWVKFSAANSTSENIIFGGYSDTNNRLHIGFENSQIYVNNRTSSSVDVALITTRLFRDPSAWYHIVVAVDTAQGSSSDRVKLYVNGVQETAFGTETYPAADAVFQFFVDGNTSAVGRNQGGTTFDGVMAHAHYCDGQAYAASDFGETDSTSGIWVAKTSPSVTYGNNGFFLKFQDTSAFGDDSSGNTNDYTLSGTITQTKDTPDNNFATMNPLNNPNVDCSYTKGNNSVWNTGQWRGLTCSLGMETGKWYTEFKITGTNVQNGVFFGVGCDEAVETKNLETGNTGYMSYRATGFERQAWSNQKVTNNSTTVGYGTIMAENDIGMIAFDATNGTIWTGVNGTWDNSATSSEIAAGTTTNAMFSRSDSPGVIAGTYFFGCAIEGTAVTGLVNWNFGNGYFGTTAISSAGTVSTGDDSQFEYDVPTGFYGLNIKNLGSYS